MIISKGYAKAKKYVDTHEKLTNNEINMMRKKNPGPCITISRQSGIDTKELCGKLIERFKKLYPNEWTYFDKDLIRRVIEDYNLPTNLYKFLAEEKQPVMNQIFNELLGIHPPILELVHKMSKTIYRLAEYGNVIIIGRGANIITSKLKNSFHIRLHCPLHERIHCLQNKKNITYEFAKKLLLREDQNRKDFLFRNFKRDIDDSSLYHFIVNISLFNLDDLTDLITTAVQRKCPINQNMYEKSKLYISM